MALKASELAFQVQPNNRLKTRWKNALPVCAGAVGVAGKNNSSNFIRRVFCIGELPNKPGLGP